MVFPASTISVLLAAATLFSVAAISDAKLAQGLHLDKYSEEQVKGCYTHNQTLGVCFDVRKGFMKMTKSTGEEIVLYVELGPDVILYQVLDQAFVGGNGPSMFFVPGDVERDPESLRTFLKHIKSGTAESEELKTHFQEAMSELHNVPEIQLLERVSAALGDNSTRLEILQPFHALCFNLLKQADVDIPHELRAAHDMDDVTADQHDREKRCVSFQNRWRNNCLGMCGRKCTCWRWVCGNCCYNRGCYEHDLCCERRFFSTYCLIPFIHGIAAPVFGVIQGAYNEQREFLSPRLSDA